MYVAYAIRTVCLPLSLGDANADDKKTARSGEVQSCKPAKWSSRTNRQLRALSFPFVMRDRISRKQIASYHAPTLLLTNCIKNYSTIQRKHEATRLRGTCIYTRVHLYYGAPQEISEFRELHRGHTPAALYAHIIITSSALVPGRGMPLY